MSALSVWAVFDHPPDFPDCYVARLFHGERGSDEVMEFEDLADLRRKLKAKGLVRMPRDRDDDPAIVETWL